MGRIFLNFYSFWPFYSPLFFASHIFFTFYELFFISTTQPQPTYRVFCFFVFFYCTRDLLKPCFSSTTRKQLSAPVHTKETNYATPHQQKQQTQSSMLLTSLFPRLIRFLMPYNHAPTTTNNHTPS